MIFYHSAEFLFHVWKLFDNRKQNLGYSHFSTEPTHANHLRQTSPMAVARRSQVQLSMDEPTLATFSESEVRRFSPASP